MQKVKKEETGQRMLLQNRAESDTSQDPNYNHSTSRHCKHCALTMTSLHQEYFAKSMTMSALCATAMSTWSSSTGLLRYPPSEATWDTKEEKRAAEEAQEGEPPVACDLGYTRA